MDRWFEGGGEVGALMRRHDWGSSPLGPPDTWPNSFRTIVRIMLSSRYAMWLGWGPSLTLLYNDAYARILGAKHPEALGRPTGEVWKEIWAEVGPRIAHVLSTGEATFDQALLLFLERHGYPEETYFTFSYSPLPDDEGRIAGNFCAVMEETERVIGERRLALLRDLAANLAPASTERGVFLALEQCVAREPRDLPFSLVYLFDGSGVSARLAARTGFDAGGFDESIDLTRGEVPWGLREIAAGAPAVTLPLCDGDNPRLPRGPWAVPPRHALVMPLAQQGQTRPGGALVAGLNPHRPLDDTYRSFIGLLVGQVAAGLANARVSEEERRRAEALVLARREAETANRAKDEFLAMLGHELRNPLAPMLTALQLMRLRGDSGVERERIVIERQTRHLGRLVDDLLDVSRIARGKIDLRLERLDAADVVAKAIEMASPMLEERDHDLQVDLPRGLIVHGDPARLAQVMANLLTNAAKYTEKGGEVAVRGGSLDGFVVLTVRDSGIGIAPEMLPRVFDMFTQERQALARTQGGLGLGLSIVRNLVELHGGTVEARSDGRNRGSEFTVRLPLAAGATAEGGAAPASRVQARPEGEGPGVLIVDDNEDAAAMLAEFVRSLGYRVRTAHDGPAALKAAAEIAPRIALLDIGLPVMDGYELAARLREVHRADVLRLIAVTGYGQAADRDRSRQSGFDAHLVKPVDLDVLAELLGTLAL